MRVADLVAETLAAYGARLAFGMPGGEVLTLVDALNAAGVRFVLARHETAAAIMAAGAAVASGGPGVLVATLGPGLANGVNGIADASQEHVPLIVLSGVVDHALRSRYTHQIFDQRAMLRSVVKGCFEVEQDGVGAVVARAVELAMAAPMGPVLIELSPGTAQADATPGDGSRAPARVMQLDIDPSGATVDGVRRLLATARRPLIIAGWDAARSGASEALRVLAERYRCPVVTTYKAKGVLPETHELSLGAAGLSPLADRHLLPVVNDADVVLLAGYDPIEMRPGWIDPFNPSAEVIDLAPRPYDHAMHRVSLRIEAEIAGVLAAIAAAGAERSPTWVCGKPQAARAALDQAFAVPAEWGPHAVIATLERCLPPSATVTVDSGAHRILLSQMMRIRRPLGLLQSAGFCTMGAALPLAAGFKSIERNRPVVAVLGDGGLEMGVGELATLRDQGLNIVLVVLQDESLALIELKQHHSQLAPAGVRLGRTRYEDVARAFGGSGFRVASAAELKAALATSFRGDTFSVIVCDIKATDYAGRI